MDSEQRRSDCTASS